VFFAPGGCHAGEKWFPLVRKLRDGEDKATFLLTGNLRKKRKQRMTFTVLLFLLLYPGKLFTAAILKDKPAEI